MTAVFRHELSSYFKSVSGYVFGAFLLLFAGIYTTDINLNAGLTNFEYVLDYMCIIFLIIVPILTMRVVAEERRQRTDQLLYSLPLTMTEVVLGKYGALLVVFLAPMAVIGVYPLILSAFGNVYLPAAYSAWLGFFLLGAALLAIGMFISSLTESQIIAAVGTFAVLLILFLWEDLIGFLPSALSDVLSAFSFRTVFYNFAQYHVFDVGGLILYLSLTALFVFLTIQTLLRRRWN